MFSRKRDRLPKPPPCPKCEGDTLVAFHTRAGDTGVAVRFMCTECRITTTAWTPREDRPTRGVTVL